MDNIRSYLTSAVLLVLFLLCSLMLFPKSMLNRRSSIVITGREPTIKLPEPERSGSIPFEHVLNNRRTYREFKSEPLSIRELSQILWAAQGITHPDGFRTAPSAGGLYPIQVHVAIGNVLELPAGNYLYNPQNHSLILREKKDSRCDLAQASFVQNWIAESAIIIVLTSLDDISRAKYGNRAKQYIFLEAGHIGQNIQMQSMTVDLVTGLVGAFSEGDMASALALSANETPLYVIPIGKK